MLSIGGLLLTVLLATNSLAILSEERFLFHSTTSYYSIDAC